jgi:hypothetical protein
MRNSLNKLLESKNIIIMIVPCSIIFDTRSILACEMKNPTMNQYLSALDSSSWLQHIRAVLDAAIFITRVRLIIYRHVHRQMVEHMSFLFLFRS